MSDGDLSSGHHSPSPGWVKVWFYKILGIVKDPVSLNIGEFEDMDEIDERPTHFALLLVLGGTVALLVGARLLVDSQVHF